MNEASSSIDSVVGGVQPPWRRWTIQHRIPEETRAVALRHGPDALVSSLERLATSMTDQMVLAGIWTVSSPGLPWTSNLAASFAKALTRGSDDDFIILQAALRQINRDRPEIGEEILRRSCLDRVKRPDKSIALLFALAEVARTNSELFLACAKAAALRPETPRRSEPLSMSGLSFATLLFETEATPAELRRLSAEALAHYDDVSWRQKVDTQQLIELSRDLLALVFLIADRKTVEEALRKIASWLAEIPNDPKTAIVFGRPITLLEEGLEFWRPWSQTVLRTFLETLRKEAWASSWITDLLARLENLSHEGREQSRRPKWWQWMESNASRA